MKRIVRPLVTNGLGIALCLLLYLQYHLQEALFFAVFLLVTFIVLLYPQNRVLVLVLMVLHVCATCMGGVLMIVVAFTGLPSPALLPIGLFYLISALLIMLVILNILNLKALSATEDNPRHASRIE